MKKSRVLRALCLCLSGAALCASALAADKPVIKAYNFGDESYPNCLSDNGKWVGFPITDNEGSVGRIVEFGTDNVTVLPAGFSPTDISDDGNIVCGRIDCQPHIYNKSTQKTTKLNYPSGYGEVSISSMTPDGKLAVGHLQPSFEEGAGSVPALWDLETGKMVETPGLPMRNGYNGPAEAIKFTQISADGRYILGVVDWYVLLANTDLFQTYTFLYDRQTQTWTAPGYTISEIDGKNTEAVDWTDDGVTTRDFGKDMGPWLKLTPCKAGAYMPNGMRMSPNAKYVTGTVWLDLSEYEAEEFAFNWNTSTKEYEVYSDRSGFGGNYVSDNGTVVAVNPATSSPLREIYVRGGGYWFPMGTILQQKYDYDFYTLHDADQLYYTGTPQGISIDGTRWAVMSDPYIGYTMELPVSLDNLTDGIDLLGAYATSLPAGAQVSALKSMTFTFGYDVDVIGNTADVYIEKSADHSKVYTTSGFGANEKTVTVTFRNAAFQEGVDYTLVIPAGTISILGDKTQVNPEIRFNLKGRASAPVKLESIYPGDGALLPYLDYSSNPIVLTFDSYVELGENAAGEIRIKGEDQVIAKLVPASVSGKVVRMAPAARQYLFKDIEYTVTIAEGTVTDLTGNGPSEAITLNFTGTYERELPSDQDIIFFDDFEQGINNVLLYEGDHLTPNAEMQSWQFTADLPWSLVNEDDYSNMAAASHSSYMPAGQSDDWMLTPQLYLPDESCVLKFKSQSYMPGKKDVLKVYVWEAEPSYQVLNDQTMAQLKSEAKLIYEKQQNPQSNNLGVMAGNWTENEISLADYAGKNVYIAFLNDNRDQSAIFVDDIEVSRSLKFLTSLAETPASTVAENSVEVKVMVAGNSSEKTYENMTAKLLDSAGKEISNYSATNLGLSKGERHSFTFSNPLPLTVGQANSYTVSVTLDGETNETKGVVNALVFEPLKRVLIEKKTGQGCGFCPLGIMGFERLERRFEGQVLPVGIHTYDGDPFGSGLSSYTEFLGLSGSPTGIVNRTPAIGASGAVVTAGPAFSYNDNYYFNEADYLAAGGPQGQNDPTWEDLVAKELETSTMAEIFCNSIYNEATGNIDLNCSVRFAMNAENQNLGIFGILVQDDVTGQQSNYLSGSKDPAVAEWAAKDSKVRPYQHNDVVRAFWGLTYAGTGGLLPKDLKAGETYHPEMTSLPLPATVDPKYIGNCRFIVVLTDGNTGKVINANDCPATGAAKVEGVEEELGAAPEIRFNGNTVIVSATAETPVAVYSLDGRVLAAASVQGTAEICLDGYRGMVIVRAGSSMRKAMIR